MPRICFEIELDTDTGEVMAGVCPPEEESGMADMEEDKSYLQPAASLDEALTMARDVLMGKQTIMGEKMKRDEVRRGYDRVKGNGMPGMMGGMEK